MGSLPQLTAHTSAAVSAPRLTSGSGDSRSVLPAKVDADRYGECALSGGLRGKDLPVALPGGSEKIDKFPGGCAQIADAARPRQSRHRQQDTA